MPTPQELRAEYEAGATIHVLMEAHGLTNYGGTWQALKDAGTPMRRRGQRVGWSKAASDRITDEIMRLRGEGMSMQAIGDRLQMTRAAVSKRIGKATGRIVAPRKEYLRRSVWSPSDIWQVGA
ncbi:hypothetical protein ACHMW5_13550 [Azospirillum melinis]|uniref:hypothetical protein n=1 Tax=Azospirillum melinis TaxID=328839 RepID=UPI003757389D